MLSEKDQPRQAFLFHRAYPALGNHIQVRTAGKISIRFVFKWIGIGFASLWLLAVLMLVAARWINPPTTGVHIERRFQRELHFNPALRRSPEAPAAEDFPLEDDLPEEIGSLHYDLAAPLIEEFVLAIDPYPRAKGVEFEPPGAGEEAPESPFAVLKGLKSGL